MMAKSAAAKLWRILNRAERRGLIAVFALSVVGMIVETLGVGLVIPALALMTQADLVVRYPKVAPLLHALGDPDRAHLVVIGMLALVSVYLIKALFLGVLAWWQMHFVYGVQSELSERLLVSYLRQPYAFHLQHNSAQLIRNAVTETNLFSQTVLVAMLSVLAESLVATGIVVLMLVVEPVGAISVIGVLGAAVWLFHHASKTWIGHWGADRQEHEGRRIQDLQQALGGVKDVKLLGREEDFIGSFHRHNTAYARVGGRFGFLTQLPKLWLEFLAVTGLAALVMVMVWRGRSVDALLPALGLFGVGAFRLLPSANRILSGVQNIRYALPAVDVLFAELRGLSSAPPAVRAEPLRFEREIELRDVAFAYEAAHRPAIDGVSLRIERGTSVGFIGTTGAGKSTLVDLVLGLLSPSRGQILVDGQDIASNPRGWQDQIGYVPQSIFLTDDTLRRNVAFGIPEAEIDDLAVQRAIRVAQLDAMIRDLPAGLETKVGERGIRLSGGQRQRIGIARAVYHDPSVLVLDEATSALDTVTEREVMDTVRSLRGDKTLIIVAHRLSTVGSCDHIYRLEGGTVIDEGAPSAVLAAGRPAVGDIPRT